MISTDKWVYIHVPKTAGTYVENLFLKHYDLMVEDEIHTTVYDIKDKKDKFIFGFVRNPYSSEWSLWNYCHRSWGIFKDFDEWCAFRFGGKREEGYEKYEHLPVHMHDGSRNGSKMQLDYCYDLFIRSQAGYFCDENQKCIASQIYRFEELRESWNDIQKRIDVDIQMNFDDSVYQSSDYKEVYTDYSYDLVSKYKAKDLEVFGYDFDGYSGDVPLKFTTDYVGHNYAYTRG